MQAEPSSSSTGSVIHDIGYRNYDGERLSPGAIERSLLALSTRHAVGIGRSVKAKLAPAALTLAACLPPIVMVMFAVLTGAPNLPVTPESYLNSISVLIALFVASAAPPLLSRDLRHRIVTLYFSRPPTRTSYVRARVFALIIVTFLFMFVPLLVLFLGALGAELDLRQQLEHFLRAVLSAALLAVSLGVLCSLISSLTQRRGIGVAVIVATLLVLTGVQATVQQILDTTGHQSGADLSAVISPFAHVRAIGFHLFDADVGLFRRSTSHGLLLLALWAAMYGVLSFLLVRRYRSVAAS